MTTNQKTPNRLIDEKSPYLLQHAYNPVDWYPWGREAFDRARTENKPIFLSIGYSTCHWCHVMERESFEKKEVAQLMNDVFINIKVDREERPDIDDVYMTVCQAMTGSGGWPLTIIMTPNQKPFFAATYISRSSQYGRIGMIELIPQIKDIWNNQREKTANSAEKIISLLEEGQDNKESRRDIRTSLNREGVLDVFKAAYDELQYLYDNRAGGFGGDPKFPTTHRLQFLLRYWRETGNVDVLEMVNKTLNNMRMGGIYDQIGFGFHRYSTDSHWLVPHFEKMLYDQALIAIAYIEGYQVTKEQVIRETVEEILEYVSRDLKDKCGAFFCAEDADSEGVEGKFYVWSEKEIDDVLRDDSDYAKDYFNIVPEGNYRDESTGLKTGDNILHLNSDDKMLMIDKEKLKDIRERLFIDREKRVRPALDDKILTDWNGLMIRAFALAGRVFDEKSYIDIAEKACTFFINSNESNGELLHRYCKGEWAITANLDDYAFLISALLEMYQSTFDKKYINECQQLISKAIELFWDKNGAGFYFTSKSAEKLLIRQKKIYDGAQPSGNSIMLENLLKFSSLTDSEEFNEKADQMIKYFIDEVRESPSNYTQMLCSIYLAYMDSGEITLSGNSQDDRFNEMKRNISQEFLPNITLKATMSYDRPNATLCLNKTCGKPTEDINEILEQL